MDVILPQATAWPMFLKQLIGSSSPRYSLDTVDLPHRFRNWLSATGRLPTIRSEPSDSALPTSPFSRDRRGGMRFLPWMECFRIIAL